MTERDMAVALMQAQTERDEARADLLRLRADATAASATWAETVERLQAELAACAHREWGDDALVTAVDIASKPIMLARIDMLREVWGPPLQTQTMPDNWRDWATGWQL